MPVASSLPRVRELPAAPLAALVVDTADVLVRGVLVRLLVVATAPSRRGEPLDSGNATRGRAVLVGVLDAPRRAPPHAGALQGEEQAGGTGEGERSAAPSWVSVSSWLDGDGEREDDDPSCCSRVRRHNGVRGSGEPERRGEDQRFSRVMMGPGLLPHSSGSGSGGVERRASAGGADGGRVSSRRSSSSSSG